MQNRHRVPEIHMKANKIKILESIIYLIMEAEKVSYLISQYDIVKALFLADKSHLNTYGRPITFDNYVAMEHGPVPSFAFDLLKDKIDIKETYGIEGELWSKYQDNPSVSRAFRYKMIKPYHLEELSESEEDALMSALHIVRSLGFKQIRRLTHEDQAYIDAWDEDSLLKAFPMSYTLLFESPDEERAKDLAFASEHL